jgi:hypothetical protein
VTPLLSAFFLLGVVGCGDEPAGNLDSGTVDTGVEGEGEGTGADDGSVPENLAVGLNITKVTANQGVAVPITNGVDWVGPSDRNTRLVGGRDTLVRVHWTLDEGWVERDIMCRLTVTPPGGESFTLENTVEGVNQDSDENSMGTTCFFGLVADEGQADAGAAFQVSVHEVGDAPAGLAEHPAIVPADGQELIGLEEGLMKMRIRLVPMTYNGGTPDVEGNLPAIRDYLFMNNPLNEIEIDVREPIETGSNSLGTMLTLMNGWHEMDGAPANMYYFAIIDTGQQSGTVGLAQQGSLWGSALWLNSFTQTRNTVVHEVGHCEGLGHVECPMQGMAPFEPYPYPDGHTGVTGFGIRDFSLHDGTINYNYMSYCGGATTTWASDWDWNRNWARIALFSGPDYENLTVEPVLHGLISPNGEEHWWTVTDPVDPETLSANHEVHFKMGDQTVSRMAAVDVLSDGESLWLTVPLPEGVDMSTVEVTRSFLDNNYEVDVDQDMILHEYRKNHSK